MCLKDPHCPSRKMFITRSLWTSDWNSALFSVMVRPSPDVQLLFMMHLMNKKRPQPHTHLWAPYTEMLELLSACCLNLMHLTNEDHNHMYTSRPHRECYYCLAHPVQPCSFPPLAHTIVAYLHTHHNGLILWHLFSFKSFQLYSEQTKKSSIIHSLQWSSE